MKETADNTMPPVPVRMDAELQQAAEKAAFDRGQTLSQFIREAMVWSLDPDVRKVVLEKIRTSGRYTTRERLFGPATLHEAQKGAPPEQQRVIDHVVYRNRKRKQASKAKP